jgi:hypothetical protein
MEGNFIQPPQVEQPSTFVAQTPTPAEPKKPLPKLPIFIAVILIILALSLPFVVFLAFGLSGVIHSKPTVITSKSTTATATNWKTFVSNDKVFSIDAPSTWNVSKLIPSKPTPDVNCLYLESNNSLLITACYRYAKLADSIYDKVPQRSGVKKSVINSFVTYNDNNLGLNDYYIVHPNGTFILITRGAGLDNNLFEKIVSTFKYITNVTPPPTSASNETATWKTYTNTEYGFTLTYPAQGNIPVDIPGQPFDPDRTQPGACGNKIEVKKGDGYTTIAIDELFNIWSQPSTISLTNTKDISHYYPFSGTNADEAYRQKEGESLMTFALYKKGNYIFGFSGFSNAINNGCITYDKKIYNWDIPTSIKFTQ